MLYMILSSKQLPLHTNKQFGVIAWAQLSKPMRISSLRSIGEDYSGWIPNTLRRSFFLPFLSPTTLRRLSAPPLFCLKFNADHSGYSTEFKTGHPLPSFPFQFASPSA